MPSCNGTLENITALSHSMQESTQKLRGLALAAKSIKKWKQNVSEGSGGPSKVSEGRGRGEEGGGIEGRIEGGWQCLLF